MKKINMVVQLYINVNLNIFKLIILLFKASGNGHDQAVRIFSSINKKDGDVNTALYYCEYLNTIETPASGWSELIFLGQWEKLERDDFKKGK